MKNLVVLFVSFVSFAALANDNYVVKLDWNKASTLSDSITMQCDDSYYPAVEIVVPGASNNNFVIEMGVDISMGKVSPGCSVQSVKEKNNTTTYTLDADGGGCTIRVFQLRPARGQKPKTAVYELSDAC
jgi:hypothetical protein